MKVMTIGSGKVLHLIDARYDFLTPACGGTRINGRAQALRTREAEGPTCKACLKVATPGVGDTVTVDGTDYLILAIDGNEAQVEYGNRQTTRIAL